MPIQRRPAAGKVFNCDFSGAVPPEMHSPHYVVVVSQKRRNAQKLCVVVPITSSRDQGAPHDNHVILQSGDYPFIDRESWIKPELIKAVSFDRLSTLPDRLGGEEARVSRECLDAIKRQLCKLFVIKADLAIEN